MVENATLQDVARVAGVHPSTVSRVIGRPDLVRPETRRRVEAAIAELAYVPNAGARQLAGGRTLAVGVLVPDIANPFFSEFLHQLQRVLVSSGRHMLVASTELDPSLESALVAETAPNVDGLVVCSPVATVADLDDARRGRPMVEVNREAPGTRSVVTDQQAIVERAVAHLHALGHERIFGALGPEGYWSTGQRRLACDRLGVDHRCHRPDFEGGAAALDAARAERATALITFNDLMALGALTRARDVDVDIPGQLSIVGSDDIAYAAMAAPALTSVASPTAGLASAVGAQLDAALADEAPVAVTLDAGPLVVRATTAPPFRSPRA